MRGVQTVDTLVDYWVACWDISRAVWKVGHWAGKRAALKEHQWVDCLVIQKVAVKVHQWVDP